MPVHSSIVHYLNINTVLFLSICARRAWESALKSAALKEIPSLSEALKFGEVAEAQESPFAVEKEDVSGFFL